MFDLVLADIESVFASTTWVDNNLKTVPANYQGNLGSNVREYVVVSVLPSNSGTYDTERRKTLSGLVAVKLFVAAGNGLGRLMEISDSLNVVLENKTLTNKTSLGTSYLTLGGLDPSNKSLYTATYYIPFSLYGE